MTKPLPPAQARKAIRRILEEGSVVFSRHAREEMAKDDLSALDIENVLRAGALDPPEFENGSWRYRVRTNWIAAIVALRSEDELVIVTAWRSAPSRG